MKDKDKINNFGDIFRLYETNLKIQQATDIYDLIKNTMNSTDKIKTGN